MKPAPTAPIFSDVLPAGTRADTYEAIQWAAENGLVGGSNGTFSPNNNMTRAEFALVLYRYVGSPSVGTPSSFFSDVDYSRISGNAIIWAHNNGIIQGNAGLFNPTGDVTRSQMILMLYRFNRDIIGGDSSVSAGVFGTIGDLGSINSQAGRTAMGWGVDNDLIRGTSGNVSPGNNITRAQVVLILYRYHNAF
jgi:hypothetical protein